MLNQQHPQGGSKRSGSCASTGAKYCYSSTVVHCPPASSHQQRSNTLAPSCSSSFNTPLYNIKNNRHRSRAHRCSSSMQDAAGDRPTEKAVEHTQQLLEAFMQELRRTTIVLPPPSPPLNIFNTYAGAGDAAPQQMPGSPPLPEKEKDTMIMIMPGR